MKDMNDRYPWQSSVDVDQYDPDTCGICGVPGCGEIVDMGEPLGFDVGEPLGFDVGEFVADVDDVGNYYGDT